MSSDGSLCWRKTGNARERGWVNIKKIKVRGERGGKRREREWAGNGGKEADGRERRESVGPERADKN